jgi:DNA-binding winged helix-turn-helix (wHTH) protein
MRYLINDLIIYDAHLKTLSNKNFLDDSLELTPGSVAVLLDFFISYPQTVWSKAEIGERAFADSAYSGSESNVNKSLSLLRRSFKDVGEDSSIITTLSSQGVIFNANVTSYDDVSVAPITVRQTTSGKKRSLLAACVLVTLTAISALYYFTSLNASECRLLNRGDPDAYAVAVKNMEQISKCKAPGTIINGVHKENEFKKNYSMVAICDQSSHSCFNFIKK